MIEVPRAFQGKSSASQALRLNALLLVISAGWGAFFLQHIIRGMHAMATVDAMAVAATLIVCLWATRSGQARLLDVGAHLTMVISTAAIIAVSMLTGQDAAMASWYLTGVPLFAAYALGTRQAVGWAIITSIAIVLIYASPEFVQFSPEYIPDEKSWLIGRFVLLGVLLGLALASRRANDANVDALAQRELIISERARELAKARDEALAAVRTKDDFLANMSHEIRTPLNGIIGMTSVLLDADQPDDQREMVKTIQGSSTALLAVLNEILDYSKLEADAVTLESIPLNVRECAEDAVDLLGGAAYDKGIEIYVRCSPGCPRWVDGDITYLRQVLLNLVGNAIKFTESGEVHVDVSAPEPGQLHFQIVDTGIGIPVEKHELLFRSFSQVDASTTRKYGGTGLGLAISKRLIELMGGSIWVESTVGEGSTFHFTIRAPEAEAPARPMSTHEHSALIGHRVALVGGKRGPHDALRDLMEEWGLIVESVFDFSQLPHALKTQQPELVVSYEDAFEAFAELVERPPSVLLVPLADAALRERAMARGVEAIVFRPVRQRTLRQAIEAVVGGAALQTPRPSFTSFDPSMGERLPARILIGEDNPVNQRVAVTVLEKLGYAPDVAANGVEVLDALARREYDLLFLDLQMPDMDGIETTTRIRAGNSATRPWIVALTASVGADQRKAVLDAGMNDFVSKPFDVQILMVAIERWAQQGGVWDESDTTGRGGSDDDDTPWGQLQTLFESAPHRLAELVADHQENGRVLVREIVAAAQTKDLAAISANAHSLKSSAAQFGSDAVSLLAIRLEAAARSGDTTHLAEQVDELAEAWAAAEERLTHFRSTHAGGSVVQE